MYPLKNFLPQLQHIVVDFSEGIEAAKENVSGFSNGGILRYRNIAAPGVAEHTGEIQEPFAEQLLRICIRGISGLVGKEIVCVIQSGGGHIAKAGNLHRCNSSSKEADTSVYSVTGEIHQYIY